MEITADRGIYAFLIHLKLICSQNSYFEQIFVGKHFKWLNNSFAPDDMKKQFT